MNMKIDLETNVVLSITLPESTYRNFEEACWDDNSQPQDAIKEFIERYGNHGQTVNEYTKVFLSLDMEEKLLAIYKAVKEMNREIAGTKDDMTYIDIPRDDDDTELPF